MHAINAYLEVIVRVGPQSKRVSILKRFGARVKILNELTSPFNAFKNISDVLDAISYSRIQYGRVNHHSVDVHEGPNKLICVVAPK